MPGQEVLRIALAGLVGIIIGRISRSSPGARLFALVCMGTALLAVVSTTYFSMLELPGRVDPGRLSAQVIKALGFIGSGLIWSSEGSKSKKVQGTDTAASIWLTAILGLLIGAGMSPATVGAVLFIVLIMVLNNMIDLDRLLGPKTRNIYTEREKEEP